MKNINREEFWAIFTGVLVILIAVAWLSFGQAADQTFTCWALCQPGDHVNLRMEPKKDSKSVGFLECGDSFETDGKTKGGFLHVFAPVEAGEGWIALGYIVREKPVFVGQRRTVESSGRVKARKTVGGKRRCWLQPGDEIMVYWAADWAVTDKGFVRADCIGGL